MSLEITLKDLDLKELGFNKTIKAEIIKNLKDPLPKSQAIILDTKKEDTLKIIQKFSKLSKLIIVQAHDATFNRTLLETRKINILLNPELYAKKDRLYERDSGLNHILCKIAKENNITIATDLKILIQKQGKEKAQHLSRIIQNIMLCKKYKVPYLLTLLPSTKEEARDLYSLKSLALKLRMDTKMAQQSTEKLFLEKWLS